LHAIKTLIITGQLPLLRNPPKDVLSFFDNLPSLHRIEWSGGHARWALDRQGAIRLRTTQDCFLQSSWTNGVVACKRDPTQDFATARRVDYTYNMVIRANWLSEFLSGIAELRWIIRAVDPYEIALDGNLDPIMHGLLQDCLRWRQGKIAHPLLIKLHLAHYAEEWSSYLELICELGEKGIRFDVQLYAGSSCGDNGWRDFQRLAPFLESLRLTLFDVDNLSRSKLWTPLKATPTGHAHLSCGPSSLRRFELVLGDPEDIEDVRMCIGLSAYSPVTCLPWAGHNANTTFRSTSTTAFSQQHNDRYTRCYRRPFGPCCSGSFGLACRK
jgi:hypothetical protein